MELRGAGEGKHDDDNDAAGLMEGILAGFGTGCVSAGLTSWKYLEVLGTTFNTTSEHTTTSVTIFFYQAAKRRRKKRSVDGSKGEGAGRGEHGAH